MLRDLIFVKNKAYLIMKLGIPGWKVKTAQEIWRQDEVKKVYAIKKGYNIKTIWEREL